MKTIVVCLVVVALLCSFAFQKTANGGQIPTASYKRCLRRCKMATPNGRVPTVCFEQCKNTTTTEKPIACKIPILKLGCKLPPQTLVLNHTSTLSDADQYDLPVNAERLWAAYHVELIKFLTKGASSASQQFTGLQLVTAPFPAEWDDNDERFQAVANRRARFQVAYEPSSILGNFDTNYCEEFVYSLDFGLGKNPAAEKAMQALYSQQDALTERQLMEETKCENRYSALSSVIRARYSSFDDYARKNCAVLMDLNRQADDLRGQIEYMWSQFAGGRKEVEARNALLKCKNTRRRWFELNPLKDFVKNTQQGAMKPFSVEISQTSTQSKAQSSYRSMGLNVIVVNFAMSKSIKQLTTSMRDFKLKISAKSYTAINVAPEPSWFNGDVFGLWRNGPFRNGKNGANFFGEQGSLSLLPRTYYVVYQPTIEFFLNNHDFQEFEKQSSFSISVMVYYLSFSFGQSKRVHKTKESDSLWRIRIEDNSTTPQVIAVNNIVL